LINTTPLHGTLMFGSGEAEGALDRAAKVIEWVKAVWASLSRDG